MRVIWAVMLAGISLAAASPLRATERYAELTGKTCTSCHASTTGGTLTSAGRAYKNTRELFSEEQTEKSEEGTKEEDNHWPISGSATLFVGRFQEAFADGSENTIGAYADLRFRVDRVFGRDDLSFITEVIGRFDHADRETEDADQVNLITAYFRLKDPSDPREIKVGRQFVSTGPRPFFLDGASYYDRLSSLLDFQVFGGLPTYNGIGGASGDFAVGGRVGITPAEIFNFGLSLTYSHDDSEPNYLQTGLDATLHASESLDLSGHFYWDYLSGDFYDSLFRARYEFNPEWALRADYAHVIPSSFLPKTSIFWVFSDSSIDEVTLDLSYTPSFDWHYHAFLRGDYFEDGGQTQTVGAGGDYLYGYHRENTVGIEAFYLIQDHDEDAAVRVTGNLVNVRAFARNEWTEAIFTAIDVVTDFFTDGGFDKNSYSVGANVGYRFTYTTVLVLGLDYLDSVQYDNRVDVHAKVTYGF